MLITEDDLTGEAIVALLQEHFDDMHAITPPGSVHVLGVESLRSPSITFWSAWQDSNLLGCGALKALNASCGEIKSMRTVEAYKRQGVASSILAHIVAIARQRGYQHLHLETGSLPAFQPARAFYEKHGFDYRTPFADYTADPNSVFMTKHL
ncbi:MAG: GNAT family N-acetyltransferase [Phormidesmis sp.]